MFHSDDLKDFLEVTLKTFIVMAIVIAVLMYIDSNVGKINEAADRRIKSLENKLKETDSIINNLNKPHN